MGYKILPHLDHVDMLEVATYRKNRDEDEPLDSVTVECTKCGEVVEELYNASEDNTPPLDCEFPFPESERPVLAALEELLSITEQFKDLMDPEYRDRWLKISAQEADWRNGEAT